MKTVTTKQPKKTTKTAGKSTGTKTKKALKVKSSVRAGASDGRSYVTGYGK